MERVSHGKRAWPQEDQDHRGHVASRENGVAADLKAAVAERAR